MSDAYPETPRGRASNDETLASAALPSTAAKIAPDSFDRFTLTRSLGRGGMGEVFLAHDSTLGRDVAVKVLSHDDPEDLERFLRESHTSARLRHPNIVAIHDAGRVPRPYIVMDFIDGSSAAGLRLPTRRAAEVVRDAARAVHYANQEGVVHRDLKPTNLMIDRAGRVYVMDFGLARSVRDAELTVSGRVMGTPSYMSPEQADGKIHVDARTDVYGLGATLYAMLTGQPPADGDSLYQTILAVLEKEPVPPRSRNPAVPDELDTIVMKCLEKDPERRYATAEKLADDLDRHLGGDPIQARPATWSYRVVKRVKKNPRLYAAIGLGAFTVSLVLAILLPAWRGAEERYTREREAALQQMRRTSAVTLRAALALRRVGDLTAMAEFRTELEEVCRQATERAPELAEPDYHLGRMCRVGMRFADARARQEQALKKEPDYLPSRYEHAVLLAGEYRTRIAELRDQWMREEGQRLGAAGRLGKPGMGGEKMRERPADAQLAAQDPRARGLREALVGDLQRLERGGEGLSPAALDCAQGIYRYSTGTSADDLQQAESSLQRAVERDPRLEEAYEILAAIAMDRGETAKAEEVYGRGLAADRGYVPYRIGRASVRFCLASMQMARGEDPSASYAAAQEDLSAALILEPDNAEALLRRADGAKSLGGWRMLHGQDPGELFTAARADLARLLEKEPGCERAWRTRGEISSNLGTWKLGINEDPEPLFESAVADFGHALEIEPRVAESWLRRGSTRMNLGAWRKNVGKDPAEAFAQAEADFGRALELNPALPDAWLGRASLRANWGFYRKDKHEDPRDLFRTADADLAKALEINDAMLLAWVRRGAVMASWCSYEQEVHGDPMPVFRKAEEYFGRALAINPGSPELWKRRGEAYMAMTEGGAAAPAEEADFLLRAEADFERALTLNPRMWDAFLRRGSSRSKRAWRIQELGEDPVPLYQAADADFAKAVEINAGAADPWSARSQLKLRWSYLLRDRGEDARPLLLQSESDGTRALELKPNSGDYCKMRGVTRFTLAIAAHNAGEEIEKICAAAESDLARATELSPLDADSWENRGSLAERRAEWVIASGGDGESWFRTAESFLDEALRLAPRDVNYVMARASLRWNWAVMLHKSGKSSGERIAAADQDVARALELDPRSADAWAAKGLLIQLNSAEGGPAGKVSETAFAEAEAAYTRALEFAPLRGDLWRSRGEIRLAQAARSTLRGSEDEAALNAAEEDLGKSVTLTPRDADAWWTRGILRHHRKRWAEAVADFETALRLAPASGSRFHVEYEEAKAKLQGGK